jgi:hypothetical protein
MALLSNNLALNNENCIVRSKEPQQTILRGSKMVATPLVKLNIGA